jgi:hypothetical protein
MTRRAVPLTLAMALAACTDPSTTAPRSANGNELTSVSPGVHRQYGTPVKVGGGRARAYVTVDQKSNTPLELGVALDSLAMANLPAPMPMPNDGAMHEDSHMYDLALPPQAPAPYRFVELDWNPQGHGEPYALAHFDFHFYTITQAERNAIDPSDPQYVAKARNFPAPAYVRPNYIFPGPLVGKMPEEIAIPHMGVHWIDVLSPEFHGAPFTTTMINGTWDGKVIFQEPMITRDFILATSDLTIPVALPQRGSPAGYYPGAYRITYDAQAREYRIALTSFAWLQ